MLDRCKTEQLMVIYYSQKFTQHILVIGIIQIRKIHEKKKIPNKFIAQNKLYTKIIC